jgi:hypothetical protein
MMHAPRRWAVVVLGALVLLGTPLAVRALPVSDPDVGAGTLLARAQASGPVAYSGYVESAGTLQLPVTDQLSDLATLLGQRSRLRVWWRSADDWRVDTLETAGETDLFHRQSDTTRWDYQAERATTSDEADIRLPRSSDLLPPELGRLALRDARPAEVSRIPAVRVAGVEAPGLRLVPAERQSTVDHVDMWLEPVTGLPLRVALYADGDDAAAVSTGFLELTMGAPPATVTRFTAPAGTSINFDDVVDVAAAAQRYAPVIAPRRLAGLGPRPGPPDGGAVGEYGRGVTAMVAIPLWDNSADPLRDQLDKTPGVVVGAGGTRSLSVGPLELMLTPEVFEDHSWLVVGTVTQATLVRAVAQLRVRADVVDDP